MQARAAGVKCGDGVGDAGRASIQRLKDMGAVSLAEAKRKCPALQIRPMRTDRYRQVSLAGAFQHPSDLLLHVMPFYPSLKGASLRPAPLNRAKADANVKGKPTRVI